MQYALQKAGIEKKSQHHSIHSSNGVKLIFILLCFFLSLHANSHSQNLPSLIFVQIPIEIQYDSLSTGFLHTPIDRYVAGARIVMLPSSSSASVNLTPEFYGACDPDISFDGNSIIFSGKKNKEDFWQIWRMNKDGTNKEQITHSQGDCITPVYAGNRFYLDDPQPTPQIIYAGTEHGWTNVDEPTQVFSLYATDPTGKSIHRITFNLYSDYGPDVLPNGQIIFISWQNYNTPILTNGHFSLLAINNDGSDLMPFYGNNEKPFYKDLIHISDFDERVYFVESDNMRWLGGGDISFLSRKRPAHSYQKLAHSDKGIFHSPCSLPGGELLASFRLDSPQSVFSIYQIDRRSGKIKRQVFQERGWHSIDMQVLLPHPKPKGRSNWLVPGATHGKFYCLNCNLTESSADSDITTGAIKFVRVIEGIPSKKNPELQDLPLNLYPKISSGNNNQIHSTACRILGISPVEQDGSFQIKVPAETPFSFQLLDSNYVAVRSQKAWTWVMGNENRGCIGCHEDPELSPQNTLVQAVTQPAVELMLPAERRRTVDFKHQIAPIIANKCANPNCHVYGYAQPNLQVVSSADSTISYHQIYNTLLKTIPGRENKRYVIPGNAKASPLVWHLFGKHLNLKQSDNLVEVKLMPPGRSLRNEERILFIEWIDLGAAWDFQSFISDIQSQ